MDWALIGSAVLFCAVAGFIAARQLRDDTSGDVLPEDQQRFEAYYHPRGYKVRAIRRLGTIRRRSMSRDGPVRTYDVDVELPNGQRETWRRGVARSEMRGHRIWRVGPRGQLEQLF